MPNELTSQTHKKLIGEYVKVKSFYDTYANALQHVFRKASKLSIPEAIIQTRAKSISSFAEKCVRKFDKYGNDAVHKMTDLCGARIIVQTLEQVKAVCLFIETNFKCIDKDDKGLLLGEDKFGYRDIHYLVRLNPDHAKVIGFKDKEIQEIGDRISEIQVRSIVQHAWADILHDRMYKAPLRLSKENKRTGALLAAIMEDGDRSFNWLSLEIDGMTSNYSAYASSTEVEREIKVQQQILKNEPDRDKIPAIALQLARLLCPCGKYKQIVKLLNPYTSIHEPIIYEILDELGYALCRVHRKNFESAEYKQGQMYLERVIEHLNNFDLSSIPNLRKQKSLLAKAYTRIAWSWEVVPDKAGEARKNYRKALETEPQNPYHLANQLGYEIYCERSNSMIESMRTILNQAIKTCREHAIAGTELPYALFVAGRLSILLGQAEQALGWYARGLRHFFDGVSCVSEAVLEDEIAWIRRIHFGTTKQIPEHDWIIRLINLARSFNSKINETKQDKQEGNQRVLIIAGGAASIDEQMLTKVTPLLKKALENFKGTAISGGTTVGIPGCVGKIAKNLAQNNKKNFVLEAYVPEYLPVDAPPDNKNYDNLKQVIGDKYFSPHQVLYTWEVFLEQGLNPNQIILLGFGGGSLTSVEYYIAIALGATVGIVQKTGGAADAILKDEVWTNVPTLLALPFDAASARALTTFPIVPEQVLNKLEEMAQAFHEKYLSESAHKLPENMQPWGILSDTYKTANLEQARYAVEILQAAGFKVKAMGSNPKIFDDFTEEDIEKMAELEHGRWNIERLREGWRAGKSRDNDKKIHDCIIPWIELPNNIKCFDRKAVKTYPKILAKVGLKISR